MSRLQHRDLRDRALRAIKQIKAVNLTDPIKDLQWIADHAPEICDRANADVDDAINARRYDGDGRGGGELTGPESRTDSKCMKEPNGDMVKDRVTGNPRLKADPIAVLMTRLLGTIDLACDNAKAARECAGKLTVSQDDRDRAGQSANARAQGTAGQGPCSNCGREVPGIATDRLRAGRCEPCYRWRLDHGGVAERPLNAVET